MTDADAVMATLTAIRTKAPLIHNITNLVVTNTTANALLAVGASPAMVEGADEVEEFVRRADALVVNLGTMSADRAAAMRLATSAAHAAGKPWVLDPVAAGVIGYRTRLVHELLERQPSVIRGNASEIASLTGAAVGGRGVDSVATTDARADVEALAAQTGAVAAVTGAVDYIADGTRTAALHNGDPMMTRVTGMGCTATALVGACLAVEKDPWLATVNGLAIVGIAGEIAAERCRGPGSLQLELLDVLYRLDAQSVGSRLRMDRV